MRVDQHSSDSDSIRSIRWRDVAEGVAGRHRDYTRGPLWPAVIALSVPMILEMAMQSIFEVVDIWFVGRLGPDAVAAVGLSSALVVLVFAVAVGLSMSAQAVVARRIGEDRREAAGSAALHAALVAVAASIGIGVAGVVFAEPLLRLMGATDAVVAVGVPYFSVLVGSNVTITLLFLLNGVLRGTGDASLAMRALWLANLLNVVLDPLFIFGLGPIPALGVTGAAVATAVGRSLGIAFQLWVMTRGRSRLRRPAGGLRMEMALVVRLLRIAGPGMVQFLIGASSFILLMRIVALFGSDAVAGYTIAFRVIIFILLPAWGIANATATLTGQNLGAGRPDRAERFVGLCTRFATLVLSVAGMLLFLAASPVVRAFTDSPEAIRAGVSCLRIVALTFPLRGATLTLVQAFNGAGDTVTPSWINFLAYWLVQIPVALTLAYVLDLGLDGVFAGIAVANGAAALVAWRLFRRGRWKLREV